MPTATWTGTGPTASTWTAAPTDRDPAARDPAPGRPPLRRADGGGHLVFGHGTHPHPGYAELADQLVTFAGPWNDYRWSQVAEWTADHPPERFCHLVHGVPGQPSRRGAADRPLAGRGHVYLTDRTGRRGGGRRRDAWAITARLLGRYSSRASERVSRNEEGRGSVTGEKLPLSAPPVRGTPSRPTNGVPVSLPPLVEPAAELTVDEVRRYSRHLIIPDVGMDGQKRLKNAKVLCVGAGGLGSPALMYLAAAGVGTLGIVEFDEVDESNLQRQIIHSQADIGRSKAESARDSVLGINPLRQRRPARGAPGLHERAWRSSPQYDLIVDGTDNFATRYLVNDACVLLNKPYVWGSIYRFDGQASVFWTEHGPCYRCLYPEPPPPGMVPSCAEGGVLGVLCASIGSIQVTEAIKLLTGIGEPLVGRLMIYDALEMTYRQVKVRKDPDCAVCGENPTVTELIDYEAFCGVVSEEAQEAAAGSTITPKQLKEWMDDGENIEIIDVREPNEYEIVSIPGAKLIPKNEFLMGTALAGPAAGQEDRPALQDGRPLARRSSPC